MIAALVMAFQPALANETNEAKGLRIAQETDKYNEGIAGETSTM